MTELLSAFYLHSDAESGHSPGSVRTYRSALSLFFNWLTADLKREPLPADLTLSNIRRYDAHCKTKRTQRRTVGLSQRTRANAVTAIRSFCEYLVSRNVLPENPAEKMKVKVTEKPKQICATEREVQALFAACGRIRKPYREALAGAVLAAMAYAGLRRAEVCDLHVDDVQIDLEQPMIIVRKGKGNKRRELPLHRDACRYFRAWLKHRPECSDPYLFVIPVCSHQNGFHVVRLTGSRIDGILRELSDLSRLDVIRHLTPHTFRRFMATTLLEVPGSSLAYVRDALGQESIITTIKYVGSHSGKLHDLIQSMNIHGTIAEPKPTTAPKSSPARQVEDNRAKPPVERQKRAGWRRS